MKTESKSIDDRQTLKNFTTLAQLKLFSYIFLQTLLHRQHGISMNIHMHCRCFRQITDKHKE